MRRDFFFPLLFLISLTVSRPVLAQDPAEKRREDSLKKAALFLEPVEVTAIRASEQGPFTQTTIRKAEIEKLNLGQDLPFLIRQTPAVVVSSDAGNGIGYTGIRIRGSDATRINMTINGIPYNDAESQGLFFVNLPDLASSVNDIQIQRGIGTSSNGAGAFGATMNFSTNEVRTEAYAEIDNSAGSFNTWKHTVRAGTGLLDGHFTVDARLSRISSDGYIDRGRSDLRSYYLSGAWLGEKSSLRINAFSGAERTYQAWNGIPFDDLESHRTRNYSGTEKPGEPYENETDNYQQDHYQFFFNHRFNPALRFNTALFFTRGRGYYESYKAGESYEDYGLEPFVMGGDTAEETDLIRQLWLDNRYYGQILSVQYNDVDHALTLGGGWNIYEGDHFGKVIWSEKPMPLHHRWYNNAARKTDVNTYLKYQRRIAPGLEIFGDLQFRSVYYDLGGFRNNPHLWSTNRYRFLNPKAGIVYTRNKTRYYASYAFASKEPNRDDFEAGASEQPRPERMHDVEMGVEHRFQRGSWSLNGYYMRYRDQLVLTGRINDVGAYTRTNIPESFRLGIEMQGSIQLRPWVQLAGNLSLSRNRVLNFTEYYDDYDNGTQKSVFHPSSEISFSPAAVGGWALSLQPADPLECILSGKYVSRQYLDNTGNKARSLDGYYVQDLRLIYSLPAAGWLRKSRLTLQVNNLFNKMYEANGYTFSYQWGGELITENYYFPMAGINFLAGLHIAL